MPVRVQQDRQRVTDLPECARARAAHGRHELRTGPGHWRRGGQVLGGAEADSGVYEEEGRGSGFLRGAHREEWEQYRGCVRCDPQDVEGDVQVCARVGGEREACSAEGGVGACGCG